MRVYLESLWIILIQNILDNSKIQDQIVKPNSVKGNKNINKV